MAIDTTAPRTRRALLAGAGGALAAVAVQAVARPLGVRAEGENIQVGGEYTDAESVTRIRNATNDAGVLECEALGGIAVSGQALGGVGVEGVSDSGVAFRARKGRLRFDQVAGVATIAAGARQVTVSPGVDVNDRSFVLLTARTNLSGRTLWYTTKAAANTFTIRMSASRGRPTNIAWLLVEHG